MEEIDSEVLMVEPKDTDMCRCAAEAGSVRICVCMGSSCFARGNGKNTRMLKEYLARSHLEQSVELVGLLCEGRCSSGPNLQIDGQTYRGVAPSALETILDRHFARDGDEK